MEEKMVFVLEDYDNLHGVFDSVEALMAYIILEWDGEVLEWMLNHRVPALFVKCCEELEQFEIYVHKMPILTAARVMINN